MVLDGDTIAPPESRLTKGDVAPPLADSYIVSILTEETRESKEKTYAAEESKNVAAQYVGKIVDINRKFERSDLQAKFLQSKLDIALHTLAYDATS